MEFEHFIQTKEFSNLHPLKQQIIQEIVNSSKNTPLEMMLPKIVNINKELRKRGLSFTNEESRLFIGILKENMTADEQKKVEMFMNFLS